MTLYLYCRLLNALTCDAISNVGEVNLCFSHDERDANRRFKHKISTVPRQERKRS